MSGVDCFRKIVVAIERESDLLLIKVFKTWRPLYVSLMKLANTRCPVPQRPRVACALEQREHTVLFVGSSTVPNFPAVSILYHLATN